MDISNETFAAARVAVAALQREIEPRILGQRRPASTCSCGARHFGEAEAVAIEPAGQNYWEQIGLWYLWAVRMRNLVCATRTGDGHYSCGISQFIPKKELEEMFQRHFAGINIPLQ